MIFSEMVYWLRDLITPILECDGLLFLDRREEGVDALREKISRYADTSEAQKWINIFTISDFVDTFVADDYSNEEAIDALQVFETCWTYQIKAKFPDRQFIIERWFDDESGDFGLRLIG